MGQKFNARMEKYIRQAEKEDSLDEDASPAIVKKKEMGVGGKKERGVGGTGND